ncbi:ferredoxin [Nocardioides aurantiacus]|uniref:ferredoxin n=1 Tax=Nocardioides aurantiacus TaxID=86796 RepID=UPI00403F4AAB
MRVSVDETKCQGHNRCMILAADTFEVDDMGFAHVPEQKRVVTEDRREAVQAAARNCPEMAISLSEG